MTASALAALAHKEKAPDAYKPGLKDGAGTTTCLGGVGPNVNQRALYVTDTMIGSEISVGGALTACAARRRAYLCIAFPSGARGSQKDAGHGNF